MNSLPFAIIEFVLRKYFGWRAYTIQLLQELESNDLPQRLVFGEWVNSAHLRPNEYENKHNSHIWSDKQYHALQELLIHFEKKTVWCDL